MLYPLTALFAVANLLTGGNGNRGKWYWAGLVFTGAHFALYAARAVRLLEKVRSEGEDCEKGEGKRALGEWLDLSFWRGVGLMRRGGCALGLRRWRG